VSRSGLGIQGPAVLAGKRRVPEVIARGQRSEPAARAVAPSATQRDLAAAREDLAVALAGWEDASDGAAAGIIGAIRKRHGIAAPGDDRTDEP